MATLKVNFAFKTDGNQFEVTTNLKHALELIDAYNTQQTVDKRQRNLSFEVHIVDNARATIAFVTSTLGTFITSVDAYNVMLDTTQTIFNTAKVPEATWQF